MNNDNFQGVIAMLVTPFDKKEDIDYGAMRAEIDWCQAQGVNGVVATPSIGEFACMSNEERWKCFEVVSDQASKHKGMIKLATIAATHTREVIQHAKVAKELGYFGAQLIAPYYWLPDEDEVYRHFASAAEVGLPIVVYHNPALSKFHMRREFIAKLATISGVIGVKEVLTDRHVDLEPLYKLLDGKTKVFQTFRAFTTALILGAAGGFINVFAVPACVKMWNLYKSGDRVKMEQIQNMLNEVFPRGGESNKKHIGTTKMVSSVVTGINLGSPRAPYMLPDSKFEAQLRERLPMLQALLK